MQTRSVLTTIAHLGLVAAGLGVVATSFLAASAHTKDHSMNQASTAAATLHASGTFDVVVKPLPFDDKAEDGVSARMSLEKQIHGDLEGTSKGQMLAAGTAVEGSGSYVALERISGTLKGRRGTFMLQHSGKMSKAGGMQLLITVVPDSGTDDLKGLAGTFTIKIVGDKHLWEFDYTLPTPTP